MSFESEYHAAKLQELRKSNANDEAFIRGMKEEVKSMLSLILLPTCQSVVAQVNAAGHRMTPDDNRTNLGQLRVGYSCATPELGEMSALVFDLTISVVAVEEDAVPLPTTQDTENHIEIEDLSRDTLAHLLNTGEKVREIKERMERATEHSWLLNIKPTWNDLANRLRSVGYNFQNCFIDEGALDIRDSELRIHIGLSAIVTAIFSTE